MQGYFNGQVCPCMNKHWIEQTLEMVSIHTYYGFDYLHRKQYYVGCISSLN